MAMLTPSEDGECGFSSERWNANRKWRVANLAGPQFGRVRVDQLRPLGVGRTQIHRWRADGYLHPELPRVYAVGHPGRSTESDLSAAVLYAGPGAMLSHATAAWWLGLLKYPPKEINVSTPRDIRTLGNVCVHGRRHLDRILHRGLPVTTPSQTIIDFAATGPWDLLRYVLANADYQDILDVATLSDVAGVAGAPALRDALKIHLPELARTRSRLERLLLTFCQSHGLPIPDVNVYIQGWLVDAHFPGTNVIVEVDGWRGHRSAAQIERDHQRDLELRAAGYVVLRYTERQLTETAAAVAADIRRYLYSSSP
jgi:very-short-patch-repair endonuclease